LIEAFLDVLLHNTYSVKLLVNNTMKNVQDTIQDAKEALPNITPTPPGFKSESSAYDLKARLEWGEPALTILDVRDREDFNMEHITGAVPMPLDTLLDAARASIAFEHDIYICGESDKQALEAANMLRGAGFINVALIKGGLSAWKEVAGPTDGVQEDSPLEPSAFNVVSRLKAHQELQKIGKAQQSK
jgi:rhodanese-related sulfurtransferase